MSNNKHGTEQFDDDFYPNTHNFSVLNQIKVQEPTPEQIEAKKKEVEILKALNKYEMLFPAMRQLMYQAALDGEDLDDAYKELKYWMAFM